MLHHWQPPIRTRSGKNCDCPCKITHNRCWGGGRREGGDKISRNCITSQLFAGVGRGARRLAQVDVILLFTQASGPAGIRSCVLVFCYYIIIRSVPLRRGKVRAHHDNRKACAARPVPLLRPQAGAERVRRPASSLSRPRSKTALPHSRPKPSCAPGFARQKDGQTSIWGRLPPGGEEPGGPRQRSRIFTPELPFGILQCGNRDGVWTDSRVKRKDVPQ